MRLKSIKLVGFKSFVDATEVIFNGNLSAVIGPNGCGKSNIIDAVRWVMGESSAKHLRGESMADVIFNGSTGRKPVSQAAIELVFDNTEGRLGGEYAQYAEIAVKRQVTRDGQSVYFLNGSRCRRKDITHIFLGTGLGPRSYAIIEQGMISRLVEARPDDLRLFIEEAAGISKYKERRRETELRMRHTSENLERLADLQEELSRQLEKLESQASSAQQYQALKADEREKRSQWLALQWQKANNLHEESERRLREMQVNMEALRADRTKALLSGEQARQSVAEQSEKVQLVQHRFYELGTELAKIEQTLAHTAERKRQLEADIEEVETSLVDARSHEATDAETLQTLEQQLDILLPDYEMAAAALEAAEETLFESEEEFQGWQLEWDQFSQENYKLQQQAEVAQSQAKQLEEQVQRLTSRHDRLKLEKNSLDTADLEIELVRLEDQLETLVQQEEALEQQASQKSDQLQQQRQINHQITSQLDQHKQRLQALVGRRSSLEALQEAALGLDKTAVNKWLQKIGFDKAPRLAQSLTVESGWEGALETVLAEKLQSVCLPHSAIEVLNAAEPFTQGSLSLFDAQPFEANPVKLIEGCQPLSDYVKGAGSWLSGVFAAATLEVAFSARPQLVDGQSIVTPDGVWVGPDWVSLKPADPGEDSLLVRQKALSDLVQEFDELTETVTIQSEQLEEGRDSLDELESSSTALRHSLKGLSRQVSDIKSEQSAKAERLAQLTQRRGRIEEEFHDIDSQTKEHHERLDGLRLQLAQTAEQMSQGQQQREALKVQEQQRRSHLQDARQQLQQTRERAHQLELEQKTAASKRDATREAVVRLQVQVAALVEREVSVRHQLEQQAQPNEGFEDKRQAILEQRLAIEQELQEARALLGEHEALLRQSEKIRADTDQTLATEQSLLEKLRLKSETARLERTHTDEQLQELEVVIEDVLKMMPSDVSIGGLKNTLDQLKQRVEQLGPINLAAIEECQTASERLHYLNQQQLDVEEALATLEEAIAKIDQETRERFKETFDVVDSGLRKLFPKVFGGGSAFLRLTGEELLETGVTIMAQPPGKRNSTIHLLSGGEKALTALALVFSIFQLNPAPFCMLDEVDAPLDDANVGRYCRLVEEMSKEVQFIYITHNKIAMEMAHNLMGVTMNEPGVSRLVSVDVEAAQALVAS